MSTIKHRLVTTIVLLGVGVCSVVVAPDTTLAQEAVRVINSASEAVRMRDVENPARRPFHAKGNFSMANGEPDQGVTVDVPVGKRLVIEHVSAFLGVPNGQQVLFSVGTRVGGQLESHSLVAEAQGVFPQILGLGAKAVFVASQSIRMYADPGSEVFMAVVRTSTTDTAAGSMTVSGYLVPIQ